MFAMAKKKPKGRQLDLGAFLTDSYGRRLPGNCIFCKQQCTNVGRFVKGRTLNKTTFKYESAKDKNSPVLVCCMCGSRYAAETYGYCIHCRPKRMKEAITMAKEGEKYMWSHYKRSKEKYDPYED